MEKCLAMNSCQEYKGFFFSDCTEHNVLPQHDSLSSMSFYLTQCLSVCVFVYVRARVGMCVSVHINLAN